MSYDVLAELRRRLVGATDGTNDGRRAANDGRRVDARARTEPPTDGSLVADGGDRVDRGERDGEDDHLRDLPDGAGCTEIWEHLSERQAAERGASEPEAIECRADD